MGFRDGSPFTDELYVGPEGPTHKTRLLGGAVTLR
jgi:hypothetical protein